MLSFAISYSAGVGATKLLETAFGWGWPNAVLPTSQKTYDQYATADLDLSFMAAIVKVLRQVEGCREFVKGRFQKRPTHRGVQR